jgi:hypothetical protein
MSRYNGGFRFVLINLVVAVKGSADDQPKYTIDVCLHIPNRASMFLLLISSLLCSAHKRLDDDLRLELSPVGSLGDDIHQPYHKKS